jgi:antagonist of KipI
MTATLTIVAPGLHTLVVDHGRPRTRSLGVPVGGAADRFWLDVGNALVGNPADTPALEVCLNGPTLVADAPLACVLAGAPFALRTDRRELTAGVTFTLQAGETLHIGGTPLGARAYLCIRGGIDVPVILGSRSSLAPLKTGDQLPCQPGSVAPRSIQPEPDEDSVPETRGGDATAALRVLPGAQMGWFETRDWRESTFTITPASNRMGLRLNGPALAVPAREMLSEPVCPGTVQVTRDGQCIILGVDGQTIGGYPKIAQVIGADLDRLGQLRPGDRARFEFVSLEEAETRGRRRAEAIRAWLMRLRVMA